MSGFELMMYIKYRNAMNVSETDPDETIRRLYEIRDAAIENNSNEWRIIADHWLTQTYLNWKKDYTVANRLAVAAAVEYRKPHYRNLREYVCVQNDLMLVYEGIDPVGYHSEIKDAIDLTIGMTTPDMACHFCMNREIIDFYRHAGEDEKARDQCAKFFAMSAGQPHYRIQAYEHLARFTYEDEGWEDLLKLAIDGSELAADEDDHSAWISLKCHQMIALYHLRKLDEAATVYQQIEYRAGSLKMVQGHDYYHLMMKYHEVQEKLDRALEIVVEYLTTLDGTGRIYWECKARLEQIRLLIIAGYPHDSALAAFYDIRDQLKAKDQFDEQLNIILNS